LGQAVGREIGLPAQLDDALGKGIGVTHLLVRVLEELRRYRGRVNAGRHEVVALVAQDAHDLGRERAVEKLDHGLAVRGVARGDGALLDVQARARAERFDIDDLRSYLAHGFGQGVHLDLLFPQADGRRL
jgi:hypothetical protein